MARILAVVALFCLFSGCVDWEVDDAVENKDPKACEKIEYDYGRDECFSRLGAELKDQTMCYRVGETHTRSYCLTKVAVSTKNVALCGDMGADTGAAEDCVTKVAVVSKDANLCEDLDDYPRILCIRSVASALGDESLCLKIEYGGSRDECYKRLAGDKKDPSLCEKVSTEKGKYYCRAAAGASAPSEPATVSSTMPVDPYAAGFDPTDPDSGNGYTF